MGASAAGRVIYLDPNDLFSNNGANNNIPQPYEDYCIAVDLEVSHADRYSCGNFQQNLHTSKYSSSNGTLSFLGGTNGVLTANYTDLSPYPLENKTTECLGIESINIAYNSWFYPEVTIKFVDVRGASLMAGKEYDYQLKTKTHDSALLNSLFTFPYPVFKLTVKGFYGKAVSYNLAVKELQGELNSQTGNFELTVSFIGYMYGLYADLPLIYCIIAPYMDYFGADYWNSNISGKFKYSEDGVNGSPIYKFVDLKKQISQIAESSDKAADKSNDPRVTELTELQNRKLALEKIKDKYVEILNRLFGDGKSGPNYGYLNGDENKKNKLIALRNTNKIAGDEINVNKLAIRFNTVFNAFTNEVVTYNNTPSNKEEQITPPKWIVNLGQDDVIMPTIKLYGSLTRDKKYTYETGNIYENSIGYISPSSTEYSGLNLLKAKYGPYSSDFKELYRLCNLVDSNENEFGIYYLFELDDGRFLSTINDKITNINGELEKKVDIKQQLKNADIARALSFYPTVGNAYKGVFAHIETFLQTFFNCLDNINNAMDNGRKVSDVSGGSIDVTNSKTIPPFPLCTQEVTDEKTGVKRKMVVLPDKVHLDNIEEMKFVDSLLDAADKYNSAVAALSNTGQTPTSFYPTTYYDFINYKKIINPYKSLLDETSPSLIDQDIMILLAQRFYDISSSMSHSVSKELSDAIGKIEAKNMYDAIQTSTVCCSSVLQYFVNRYKDQPNSFIKNFIQYITGSYDEGTKVIASVGGGSGQFAKQDYEYTWVKKDFSEEYNTLIYPIGVYGTSNISKEIQSPTAQTSPLLAMDIVDSYDGDGEYDNHKVYIQKAEELSGAEGILNTVSTFGIDKKTVKAYEELFSHGRQLKINSKYTSFWDESLVPITLPEKRTGTLGSEYCGILFLSPMYYAQNYIPNGNETNDELNEKEKISRYSKAYLTLITYTTYMSKEEDLSEILMLKNGKYSKCYVLLAGALLWRRQYMTLHIEEDPIVLYDGGKCAYGSDYCHRVNSAGKEIGLVGGVTFYKEERYINLCDLIDNNFGHTAKVNLINYFTNWADNDFEQAIRKPFELNLIEGNKITTVSADVFKSYLLGDGRNLSKEELNKRCNEHFCIYSGGVERKFEQVYEVDQWISGCNCASGKIKQDYLDKAVQTNEFALLKDEMIYFYDVGGQAFYRNGVDVGKCRSQKGIDNMGDCLNALSKSFISTVVEIFKQYTGSTTQATTDRKKHTDDMRLATYLNLKSLYDKWLCGNNFDKWKIDDSNGSISEFNHFKYVDYLNNDIKDRLIVGLTDYVNQCFEISATHGNKMVGSTSFMQMGGSVYELFSRIAQDNRMNFMALPMLPTINKQEDLTSLFTAYPFLRSDFKNTDSSTFLCMYVGENSSHVGIKDGYNDDGFMFVNEDGGTNGLFSDVGNNTNSLAVFGVTYAKQNQSYFKDITVNMQNPVQTEASIRATQDIASLGSSGPREVNLYGQDLYSVYHGYSYTCTVEMLGNAQIAPMMYFQLNNMPLFKGAYQIIKVEHNIRAGEMTTTFTGVRLSSNSLPFVDKTQLFSIQPDDIIDQSNKPSDKDTRYDVEINDPDANEYITKYQKLTNTENKIVPIDKIEELIKEYKPLMDKGKVRLLNRIVVHCTAGSEESISQIDNHHKNRMGYHAGKYSGMYCGYHFVIGKNGDVWVGRYIAERGAHAAYWNSKSVGISYVGGVEGRENKDTRTDEQKESMMKLIKALKKHLGIKNEDILGHKDVIAITHEPAKACPCFTVQEDKWSGKISSA